MNRGYKKILLLIVFIFLILFSESIYILNNHPSYFVGMTSGLYYPRMMVKIDKGDLFGSIYYLDKISKSYVFHEYNNLSVDDSNVDLSMYINEEEFDDYLKVLRDAKKDRLEDKYNPHLASLYYKLGVEAHEDDHVFLTEHFFKKAYLLAPEWSYFHLELSNAYMVSGNVDLAIEQLKICSKFKYPKDHCGDFLDKSTSKDRYEEVGFLSDFVKDL